MFKRHHIDRMERINEQYGSFFFKLSLLVQKKIPYPSNPDSYGIICQDAQKMVFFFTQKTI